MDAAGVNARPVIEYNQLGGQTGISLSAIGNTDILVRGNIFACSSVGVAIQFEATGTVSGNDIKAQTTGINIAAAFSGRIEKNNIHDAKTGIIYAAAATLSKNRIYNNVTGIDASVADIQKAFGFVGLADPNEIYGNDVGVKLVGRMQGQNIHHNKTGVSGSGILGPVDAFDLTNSIEDNETGVVFAGVVQFNRIGRNVVGLVSLDQTDVLHNLFYRNTTTALSIKGHKSIQVFQNSFYATGGDLIRIESAASDVEILNNILFSESGYDLYVGNDSRNGFYSDYNILHSGADGKLVFWAVDFKDILDWQADVAQFDLHSYGRTLPNPNWSRPRFYSLSRDDYQVFDISGSQRLTSPSIDAGAAFADRGLLLNIYKNLLVNPEFESGLTGWSANPEASVQTKEPSPYQGSNYFYSGSVALGYATQTIDLAASGFTAAQIDSRNLVVVFGGRVRVADETPTDKGTFTLAFQDASGKIIGDPDVVSAKNTADRWELVGDRVHIPVGARKVAIRFEAIRETQDSNSANTNKNNVYLDGAFVYAFDDLNSPDIGAYGNTKAELNQRTDSHLALRTPDLYVDWESALPQIIHWDSFGNRDNSLVRIDLYQDGPTGPSLRRNLTTGTLDTGFFKWIPINYGVENATYKLRIMVSLVNQRIITDRSTETYSAPESTNTFYANDGSIVGDEYTTSPGSNRNTGKLASSPKPNPVNLLRIYSIGPTQTLYIDSGEYKLHHSVLISNILGTGDDEGFAMTGPVQALHSARLVFANPLFKDTLIDVDGGDYLTLSYLEGANAGIGLLLRNASGNFRGDHLAFKSNLYDGVRVDAGCSIVSLAEIFCSNNGDYGIYSEGEVKLISRGEVNANGLAGISVYQKAAGRIESMRVHDNTQTADARNERGGGIIASGPTVLQGNVVYNEVATSYWGIDIDNSASALGNIVYSCYNGLSAWLDNDATSVIGNRVYHNANYGIEINGSGSIKENTIYSNKVGLWIDRGFIGTVGNNVVYGNAIAGVAVQSHNDDGMDLVNNTIYQPTGDGIYIQDSAVNVRLRNNIIWVEAGAGIRVDNDSQTGFVSDYNLIYAKGTGAVGKWQETARPTMESWRSAAFTDQNSIGQDPLFVGPAGLDGTIGYSSATSDGRDDDFHLRSNYGSFHGGMLAPVIDKTTGLPGILSPTEVKDAGQSPAIDRGDAQTPVGNEPAANGGYVNLGAYGGTAQASKSPAQYVVVLSPDGGELSAVGRKFDIRWRSQDNLGTVAIELYRSGIASPILTIGSAIPNTGLYSWTIGSLAEADNYLIKITRGTVSDTSNGTFSIRSAITVYYVNDGKFESGDWTTAPGNDANNGISPSTPKASIRAILQAYDLGVGDIVRVDSGDYSVSSNILITGDDSGVKIEGYHNSLYPNRVALLNRNNTSTDSYVFDVQGASDVTMAYLTVTGARVGIYASDASKSSRLTIQNCSFAANSDEAIFVGDSNDHAVIQDNQLQGLYTGAGSPPGDTGIEFSGAEGIIQRNRVHHYGGRGIVVSGIHDTVSSNECYSNGSDGIYYYNSSDIPFSQYSLIQNNQTHNNGDDGIDAGGAVRIDGNTVYLQSNKSASGIDVWNHAWASGNIIYDNYVGLNAAGTSDARIEGNRIYHNTLAGITDSGDAVLHGNLVYGNGIGIVIRTGAYGTIENNLIYDNATQAVKVEGHSNAYIKVVFSGNVLQQAAGTVVQLVSIIESVELRNNILWAAGGVAMSVDALSEPSLASDYNLYYLTNNAKLSAWEGKDVIQWSQWAFELGFDFHGLVGDPKFIDPDGADNVFGYDEANKTDCGGDDNFRLASGSPAIDRGNPVDYYLAEPGGGGGRIDIGAYGNTANAAVSPAQLVQVVSSNGYEKFVQGQTVGIDWRSFGLGAANPIGLINAGGETVSNWLYDRYCVTDESINSLDGTADLSKVTNPAPLEVYQSLAVGNSGVGSLLAWNLPVPDGNYTVRLHFVAPKYDQTGQRVFDIALQGNVTQANFDAFAAAGGTLKAITREFNVTAAEGKGIQIELRNKTAKAAVLAAIEITSPNAGVMAYPTFKVEATLDSGASWLTIASNANVNVYGTGALSWYPGGTSNGNSALVRVTANKSTPISDTSDAGFTVTNNGHEFFLNDSAFQTGDWTTAAGDDLNGGKDPMHPMRSISALVRAWGLKAGDMIHVDAGLYNLLQNTVFTSAHNGASIIGYSNSSYPDRKAVFNRGNQETGSEVFVFSGSEGITIKGLQITGANIGILADAGAAGDFQILDNDIYGNKVTGVVVDSPDKPVVVSGNRVYQNGLTGLDLKGDVRAVGNAVYGHVAASGIGITLADNASAYQNIVSQNTTGILVVHIGTVDANRVFGNKTYGIRINANYNADGLVFITDNWVYDNASGIFVTGAISGGAIRNNLIYANSANGDAFAGGRSANHRNTQQHLLS